MRNTPKQTPLQRVLTAVNGRPIEDWLREQYVDKGYSDQDIAKAVGVTRQAISNWRAQYGIARPEKPPLEPLVPVQ